MKKVLFAGALLITATAFSQTSQPSAGGAQPGAQGAPAAQTKTIADQAEYAAYVGARDQQDPAAKGQALEAFVQQYPNSVVKEDALVQAMAAYQQANNLQKSVAMAGAILQIDPNNVPALAVQTYVKRSECGQQPQTAQAQCFAQVGQMAQTGLQQLASYNPPGANPADVEKQKATFSQIFNGSAGQAAMVQKDYANAQKYLSAVVQANPNSLQDVYQLGLAYAQQTPPTDESLLNGVWYLARTTAALQQQAAKNPALQGQVNQVAQLGQFYLNKYHGKQADSQQLWNNVVQMAATSPAPPANYASSIPKAPSPAEQVKQMLQESNGDITKMSFGEWILIFTYGDEPTKQQAFNQIANKPFGFSQTKVLAATENSVDLAMTEDGIQAGKPEARVTMAEPFKKVPEVGSIMDFQGNPVKVTSNPFLMEFDNGIDRTKRAPAPRGKAKATPKTKAKAKARR